MPFLPPVNNLKVLKELLTLPRVWLPKMVRVDLARWRHLTTVCCSSKLNSLSAWSAGEIWQMQATAVCCALLYVQHFPPKQYQLPQVPRFGLVCWYLMALSAQIYYIVPWEYEKYCVGPGQDKNPINEKKRSQEAQTLHAGCSKAEPNIFAPPQTPFPGARDGQNLISWKWSLPSPIDPVWWGSMHAILSYRGKTHPRIKTNRQDQLQYTALQVACSVTIQ